MKSTYLLLFLFVSGHSTLFSQTRTIYLDDELLLSSAQLIAIDSYIGILDGGQNTFLLLDHATGKLITRINASDSFPGFNWSPIRAHFLSNEVFFTNSAPWGVYVSYENDVTHVAGRDFLASGAYDFLNDSLYVGFYTRRNGDHRLMGVDRDGQPRIEFERVEVRFPNLTYRSDEYNAVLIHGNRIYLVPAYEQIAQVFDVDGRRTGRLDLSIEGFRAPTRDKRRVDGRDMSGLLRELANVVQGRSSIKGLYSLNADEILVTTLHGYETNGKSGMVTRVNTNSGKSESKWVRLSELPVYAENGKIYMMDIASEPIIIRIVDVEAYW